ncbi:Potassium/sodium hyperpolarization-activated cyclic nucleotide-gated channel 4 [Echinococcus granulosus]|uniref:Potassium/sodium hyperpolarization-activated cyclic nucleotide-gated channel 4 n=1 Tax=Echinococcus granulosus TaxID=6210 RepID=W6UUE9_ECHGR|nr:Potassium/sodium hyperpolarization-activated cyclic nucleotide-gated channel 4 [Echinococcus granulosus]EUB61977.1 Potassium/sodium hyperpolarization-activated cyclic nucleotide-gated channel 4 [Echinococcus granulosus]
MPNLRQAQQVDGAWTQPSTPRRRRNLSGSPSNASARAMRQHILHSQASVAIDQPIQYFDPNRADKEIMASEDFRLGGPRKCLYTSYLRGRLRETRPYSLDDGTIRSQHRKSTFTTQREKPFVARAISFDNPYFDVPQGESQCSNPHPLSAEKPFLHSIQSCTAEEDESELIDTTPALLSPMPKSDLVVNSPVTESTTTPQAVRRIYKSRLHRSVTIGTGDEKDDEVGTTQSMTPSPHPPSASQFRSRGMSQKTRWTSRIARMKSLQRSRTIDTRVNTVQWNPGSLLTSPDIDLQSSDTGPTEYQPLQGSTNKPQKWSPNESDLSAYLPKHVDRSPGAVAYKKGRLDAGTQYCTPSSSMEMEQASSAEMGSINRSVKVSLNSPDAGHYATQSSEIGSEAVGATMATEGQIPLNAAAMADGHVEELCDPSKQSTSSYLKEQFFAFFQPSDNKLAMKLFGSKSALNKEKRRQQQHGKWIIHPCSSFRSCLIDCLVINDLMLEVFMSPGIITNDYADEIILDPKEIARQYVRSWFLLDLISSIPMDYIFWVLNKHENYNQILTAGRTLRILRLAKLLSMLRLLRLTRLVRYVSQWEEDADWFEQYTWALFKAMSHMLSIGYGRFPPTSISEAWITIVSMMTGATCYALFVGHAAALIQSFDTSKRHYREKFKQVEEYMAYRKLPRALRQRIADYYEHRYQGKMFDEAQILQELSECLREQIINYNCRELVAAVPFFTYADQDFVSEMVANLKFEVFQPGDLIIKEGTIGTKMYFIQEGIVDIITKDGEIATTLSDGSYFGEICLLTNAKRVASVRAEVYSNLYSLDRDSFLAVLDNYPLMRRTMESVAAERLSKIGQNPSIVSARADLKADLSLVKEIVSSVVESDDGSDSSSDDSEGGRKDKEERGVGRIRRVIQMAKSRKKPLVSEEPTETSEVIQREDSVNESKYLTVPKADPLRKRSHNRVFGISSGVSKLFKRGGVFGEHTDNESEAYLSWDRARQQRFTRLRSSIRPTIKCTPLHPDDKKHSLNIASPDANETLRLVGTKEIAPESLITDPDPTHFEAPSLSPLPSPPPSPPLSSLSMPPSPPELLAKDLSHSPTK